MVLVKEQCCGFARCCGDSLDGLSADWIWWYRESFWWYVSLWYYPF